MKRSLAGPRKANAHLVKSGEILGMKAADRNYIAYYQDLMQEMRRAIADGCFDDFSVQRKRLGNPTRDAVSLSLTSKAFSPNSEGDKALAHIHLAHANLPRCDEERALRLFVADELVEARVTPAALMKAQGFDPTPLALLKYNPDQPSSSCG
jgi:hypothetical protein